MIIRPISVIFPPDYPNIPDEEDLRRTCREWLELQLPPNAMAKRIDDTECPFLREAMVTAYIHTLDDFAEETGYPIPAYIREDIECRLQSIKRIAHAEQTAIERTHLEKRMQVPVRENVHEQVRAQDEQCFEHMQMQIQQLEHDVSELKNERQSQPTEEQLFRYISPFVTDPAERLHIHRIVVNTISSGYSMAEIVRILHQLEKEGKIALHVTIQSQFDELVRLGLPTTQKGYTCKNYENYMSASKYT